jgi:transposase
MAGRTLIIYEIMRTKQIKVGNISKTQHTEFHKKLKLKYGNATKCEAIECKSESPKRFEWALKKGNQYSANREDYFQLCPSCHRKYDLTDKARENMSKRKQGEKHNHAKLTESQVREIVTLVRGGKTQKEVAQFYKIHPSNVSDMKRGKRWPHLHHLWTESGQQVFTREQVLEACRNFICEFAGMKKITSDMQENWLNTNYPDK